MKSNANIIVQIITNLILVVGCLMGYWNFSATMFVFMFEIVALIFIGFIYLLMPSTKGQPGPLLFGGGLIITICLLTTWLIAHNIGEVDPYKDSSYSDFFTIYFQEVSMEVWPLYIVAFIGVLIQFFKHPKWSKNDGIQVMFFRRIFSLFGIIILSITSMYFLNIYNHLIILVCIIVAKTLVDLWLRQKPEKVNTK